MKECKGCQEINVDPEEPPRYDVFNPNYTSETPMSEFGPYCQTCFASTATGLADAAQ